MDRIYKAVVSVLIVVICLYGATVSAEDYPRDAFGEGKRYASFQVGYGEGLSFGFMGQGDGRTVEYLATFPSFGVGISDIVADDSWFRGNVDVVLEGEFITGFKPVGGYSAGAALLFRYNFLRGKRFVPYIEGGAGIGYLEFDLFDQADGLIFYPQIGVGAHYFVTDNVTVNGAWRIHHMSNAGSELPNNSINANLFLIGLSYFFD